MATILEILSFITAGITLVSFIIFDHLMKKYRNSAVHTIEEENGVMIEKTKRDPKLKKYSLIAKAITIILFIITFALMISCSIMKSGIPENRPQQDLIIFLPTTEEVA